MEFYNLQKEYTELMDMLVNNHFDNIFEKWISKADSLLHDTNTKFINLGLMAKNIALMIASLETHISDVAFKMHLLEESKEALKNYIENGLKTINVNRIESPLVTIEIKKDKVFCLEDEEKVPDEYKINYSRINLEHVEKISREGVKVPGTRMVYMEKLEIK